MLCYPRENSIVEVPVDLLETPDFIFGHEEMAQMFEKTMNE